MPENFTLVEIDELTVLAEVPADDDEFPISDTSASGAAKAVASAYVRRFSVVTVSSSGSQSSATTSKTHIKLNHASAINLTLTGAPVAGDELTIIAETGATHTVTLSGAVKWNAASNTIVTFNAIGESLHCVAYSAARWDVISFNGVAFS